jgi:hypothetical protein
MAGGPRKTVFSTLAKTADRKEDRRIKQDTRSILIVLFTPREVKIKVLKRNSAHGLLLFLQSPVTIKVRYLPR